tara:strand:+ start:106 stop:1473 length:1368 start_codon:yes stop_codon:yes gene_type:complete
MSQIPDLLKIGAVQSDMEVSVDTDTLEPVVISDSFCRFTLQNKGFMNSFSKIILGCGALTGTAKSHTYPLNVGISALVERATLKVGAKTISEVEDFGHFMAYKSLFIDPSQTLQREQVITGRNVGVELRYQNASGEFSDYNASSYGLSNGLDYIDEEFAGTTRHGLLPYIWQEMEQAPQFQISLADLFPFLRFNSLPLYMFDEQISVELTFNPNNNQRQVGSDAVETLTIDTAVVKLIADYIYYDGDTMEQFAEANRSMNFQYIDYQLNKRTLSKAQAETKQILNVGGAGRIVSKMFHSLSRDNVGHGTLCNVYHSQAPNIITTTGARQVGTLTTNVRLNDKYLYPLDRVANAIHFHDITSTEATPPHVSRDFFSRGGGTITSEDYSNLPQSNHLRGHFFWNANRLNRNERINSRGIELELKYSNINDTAHTHRTWIEVIKTAQLTNGILDIQFA